MVVVGKREDGAVEALFLVAGCDDETKLTGAEKDVGAATLRALPGATHAVPVCGPERRAMFQCFAARLDGEGTGFQQQEVDSVVAPGRAVELLNDKLPAQIDGRATILDFQVTRPGEIAQHQRLLLLDAIGMRGWGSAGSRQKESG